jgi:hypothetical protein
VHGLKSVSADTGEILWISKTSLIPLFASAKTFWVFGCDIGSYICFRCDNDNFIGLYLGEIANELFCQSSESLRRAKYMHTPAHSGAYENICRPYNATGSQQAALFSP